MDVEEIPIPPYTAFPPRGGRHVDQGVAYQASPYASPAEVVGLRDEIRHLRRELRYQKERAERNLQYERDRVDRLVRDAEQARRHAAMLAEELHSKRIELVTLEVEVEHLQIRLRAQEAINQRHRATAAARRVASQRVSTRRAPGGWLRGETLLSGLIGVCIGKALASPAGGAAADDDEAPAARGAADDSGSQEAGQTNGASDRAGQSDAPIKGASGRVKAGEDKPTGREEAVLTGQDHTCDRGEDTVGSHDMASQQASPGRSPGSTGGAREETPDCAGGVQDSGRPVATDPSVGVRTAAPRDRKRLLPSQPQHLARSMRSCQPQCAAGFSRGPWRRARLRRHMGASRTRSSLRGQLASRRTRRPPVRPPGR